MAAPASASSGPGIPPTTTTRTAPSRPVNCFRSCRKRKSPSSVCKKINGFRADHPQGLTDFTTELSDFANTAALISNLDLVITVDTSVAHLAGAIAKPTWVLLPFVTDWRWLRDRDDSPWYPTLRLFRQTKLASWKEPVEQVVRALADLKPA